MEPVHVAFKHLDQPTARIRADIRDTGAIGEVLDGCEIVYHLAAVISVAGGLGGLVHSVNVDGVRSLAQAALERGVPRLVHCSSVHAFDLAALHGQPCDESSPRAVRRELPAYDRSKAAGEVELHRAIDCGLDAVVVNPSGIVGPVDDAPSRMGSVLLAMWRRRLPALVAGGFDWVDVRDVVSALRAALATRAADRARTGPVCARGSACNLLHTMCSWSTMVGAGARPAAREGR